MAFAIWMFTSRITIIKSFLWCSERGLGLFLLQLGLPLFVFPPGQYMPKRRVKRLMPKSLPRARKREGKLRLLDFSFTSDVKGNNKTRLINILVWKHTAQLWQNLFEKKSTETRFKFRITIATERREGKITRLLSQIKPLKE